jgi:hypothetical protein
MRERAKKSLTTTTILNSFPSSDHHEIIDDEIDLKLLNESDTKSIAHIRKKRSIQSQHQLSPYQQQLQRHRQRQYEQRQQYEQQQQRERREREMRERQRNSHSSSHYRSSSSNHHDVRQYHAMSQQPPQQQQLNNNMYHYQHDYQNSMLNVQQKNSEENKEFTIEVLVAVDRKMQEYHGKNLKNYVLTLMSVVSNFNLRA